MNMAVTFLVTLVVVQVKYIATTPTRDSGQASSCKVMPHFQSPYVTPLVEQVSQVTGCVSRHVSSKSQEIYMLSLSSSGVNGSVGAKLGYLPSVSLHVRPRSRQSTYTNPFVIILQSSDPVMWHLHIHNVENASNLSVVVNKPSQLVSSTPVSMSRKHLPLTNSLLSWAHNQYGAVTSFLNISLANKISLFIGIDEQSPDHCNNSNSAISGVSNAVYVQPQPAAGCAVKEDESSNYTWTETVHIVDVESSGLSNTIIVHIQPHGVRQPSEDPIIEQNLILVLKSHSLVSWWIESWGIQGRLKIVAEHPVRVQTSPRYQVMEVQDKILPSNAAALITDTEKEYGQVFTYTKAARANRINIIIKGLEIGADNLSVQSDSHFSSQQSSSKLPFPLPETSASSIDVNEKQPLNATRLISAHDGSAYSMVRSGQTDEKSYPKNILEHFIGGDMRINCMNTITVLFPYEKVNQVLNDVLDGKRELLSITLNDSRCKADVRNSFIVLHSTWNGCGAKLMSIGDREIHYNQVKFLTKIPSSSDPTTSGKSAMPNDDEDMTESGSGMNLDFQESESEGSRNVQVSYTLPYRCSRHLPQSTMNASGDSKHKGEAVFRLNLYLDKSFQNALPDQLFPLRIEAHDYMFAEAIIEADPYTCVATEECWLSAYSNGSFEATKSMLIKKGCPSDLSVEMISRGSCQDQHPFSSKRWQRFSFQISEEFVNEYLYLHCRLSTCAMVNGEQRRMKQCTDMQDFCVNQSLRPFLKLPAGKKYGLEVRGPLHVFAKRRNGGSGNKDIGVTGLVNVSSPPIKDTEVHEKNTITQVILIGLTTEAVVGIAFASFVIGAGFMATLWLIHLRTDPSQRVRTQQRQMPQPHQPNHHSGYDLSGHSGSSTPSSQAPMTVHACT